MSRCLAIISLLLLFSVSGICQSGGKGVSLLFYNVENLFDTINTLGTRDAEFTPEGKNSWNTKKYLIKNERISQVLSKADNGADIIGLAEIENAQVIEDLLDNHYLVNKNYDYVHYESHDSRGIDVALLYRKDRFQINGSQPISWGNKKYIRECLLVWGEIENTVLHIIVAHTPSQLSTKESRELACRGLRIAIDSIAEACPKGKIVVMGDFNDNPNSTLLASILGFNAKVDRKMLRQAPSKYLYNPFAAKFAKGAGSIVYNRRWQMYDNIVVNGNIVLSGAITEKTADDQAKIYCEKYILESKGAKQGFPRRTIVSKKWQDGYSDHLPVMLWLDL